MRELLSLAEDPLARLRRAALDYIHRFPCATQDLFKSHYHTGQGSAISWDWRNGGSGPIQGKAIKPDKRKGGVDEGAGAWGVFLLKAVVKEI